jgi:hypothetical protein
VFSKPPVVLINPIKCARGVLKLPKIKSHLWLVKAVFSGRDVFGGNAEWKGVKRASILCHGKLWPVRSDKPKKQRFRYGYRRRCFFDFHWYDFYMKSLIIKIISSILVCYRTLNCGVYLAWFINEISAVLFT